MMSSNELPIRERSVVAFDCETTGLHVEKNHNIIGIALVKHNPDGSIEEWSSLIKPTKRISASNQASTASLHLWFNKPLILKTSIQNFKRLFQTVFWSHTILKFDVGFLKAEAQRNNLPVISDATVVDTLAMSRRFLGFQETISRSYLIVSI